MFRFQFISHWSWGYSVINVILLLSKSSRIGIILQVFLSCIYFSQRCICLYLMFGFLQDAFNLQISDLLMLHVMSVFAFLLHLQYFTVFSNVFIGAHPELTCTEVMLFWKWTDLFVTEAGHHENREHDRMEKSLCLWYIILEFII